MQSSDILKRLPRALVAQPFELLVSLLLGLSSVTVVFGLGETNSLEKYFDRFSALPQLWGVSVFLGCVATLVGLQLSVVAKNLEKLVRGHRIESLGLVTQGFASMFYGVAVIFFAGRAGVVSTSILLTITLVCFVRAIIINGTSQILLKSIQDDAEGEDRADGSS